MKAVVLWAFAGSAFLAVPVDAHHSAAMFDQTKVVTVDGTVRSFEITNPHSWLQVVAPNPSGALTEWSVEMGNPTSLLRRGFKRSSIKPGDKVSVKIHPLKDGRPGGLIVTVRTAAGVVLPNVVAPIASY